MDNVSLTRLAVFLGVFVVMAVCEALFPARQAPLARKHRWTGNLLLMITSTLAARVVMPLGVVGLATLAEHQHWGVLNIIDAPFWVSVVVSLIALDCIIYWQHRLFHTVPLLWRFHRVHHADSHVDTTTGLRFHPIEIAISVFIKCIAAVAMGVPAIAVVVFEIVLNACALFNHANIRLLSRWEKAISALLITQRLHRIHHSQHVSESNTNFGFSVVWWDKLFGSFMRTAQEKDELIEIGQIDCKPNKSNANVLLLLTMPFKRH